ncbi:heme o synthase [Buchnera aphidicola]|uniref:heme o synthase n=1 Tax=Buchnera aphidicola TaxID=9 RepID=UPI0025B05833|nr:heme o synthase [Buchnera aphidicola]
MKPRIVLPNLLSTSSGFFLASNKKSLNIKTYFFVLLGTFFIISCGCVLNNIIDRKYDMKMERTKDRILAKNKISLIYVFIFSLFLFILGTYILLFFINTLSYLISFFGLFSYVFLYTFILKKNSEYSTIFGSFAGACPIIIGYSSVKNSLDYFCLILFFIFFFWQIPHSYSIYLLNLKDYKNANISVFPVLYNIRKTIKHMYFYLFGLILFTFIFTFLTYSNFLYSIFFLFLGFYWLFLIKQGDNLSNNKKKWFRKIFRFSIFYIILLNFSVFINYLEIF